MKAITAPRNCPAIMSLRAIAWYRAHIVRNMVIGLVCPIKISVAINIVQRKGAVRYDHLVFRGCVFIIISFIIARVPIIKLIFISPHRKLANQRLRGRKTLITV